MVHTTPVKSTVIGGEDGGRAPVILKGDAIGEAPDPKHIDTTTLLLNVPQPGHDVFAEKPVKDINSQDVPNAALPPPPAKDEDKEVSKVVVAPPEVQTTKPPVVEVGSEGSKEKGDADPAVHGEDKPVGAGTEEADKKEEAVAAEEKPAVAVQQGPLEHDEAEAEKVREDLFPDVA